MGVAIALACTFTSAAPGLDGAKRRSPARMSCFRGRQLELRVEIERPAELLAALRLAPRDAMNESEMLARLDLLVERHPGVERGGEALLGFAVFAAFVLTHARPERRLALGLHRAASTVQPFVNAN